MIGNRNYKVPKGRVLVMRTCTEYGFSYANFSWPESGPVSCTDWKPEAVCGHGLHGALWGEGNGDLFNWDSNARWQIVEVHKDLIVDLRGKVKYPKGNVVATGNQIEITEWLAVRAPDAAIIGRNVIEGGNNTVAVGDRGKAFVGDHGHATAGNDAVAIAGDGGIAVAGRYGLAKVGNGGRATTGSDGTSMSGRNGISRAGYLGTATAGPHGFAVAGEGGTATVGSFGKARVGERGFAIAGYKGTVKGGVGSELSVRWPDDGKLRQSISYVGQNGIEPNVEYRCNDVGRLVMFWDMSDNFPPGTSTPS